jgi:sugar phosphate isomerase/epimerase
MVKIALDPAMYHASMSVADELRKAADLGYEYLELSPRADWFFWHRYPKADDAMVVTPGSTRRATRPVTAALSYHPGGGRRGLLPGRGGAERI